MFRAARERDPGFRGYSADFGGDEEEEEQEEGDGSDGGAVVPKTGTGGAIETEADACVLWCTIAMGCLIRGRPKSSVSSSDKRVLPPLSRGICRTGWGVDDAWPPFAGRAVGW